MGLDFIARKNNMILSPFKETCQAFDPMMILESKTSGIITNPGLANTSCKAPAYIYLEGARGKRFLCDFHFFYEKDITLSRTNKQWQDIEKIFIDKLEEIKTTFPESTGASIENFEGCWCKSKQSYVKLIYKKNKSVSFLCNFHYRKLFYRYLSNDRFVEEDYDIIDERSQMKISIREEAEQLTIL